jgi:Uncharacterized protein conserved in bacteria (DUF2313).
MNLENFPTNIVAQEMLDMVSKDWYEKSYLGKWLFQVMGIEIEEAKVYFQELREQIFPELCTWAVSYHEQKYGIVPNEMMELEERVANIKKKRNFRSPLNIDRMKQIMETITQKEVEVEENIAPYTFLVRIFIKGADGNISIEQLKKEISEIKPSHLTYIIITERPLNSQIYLGAKMQQSEILTIKQVA